jgi:hypothetical protein
MNQPNAQSEDRGEWEVDIEEINTSIENHMLEESKNNEGMEQIRARIQHVQDLENALNITEIKMQILFDEVKIAQAQYQEIEQGMQNKTKVPDIGMMQEQINYLQGLEQYISDLNQYLGDLGQEIKDMLYEICPEQNL